MDKAHYNEMAENLRLLFKENILPEYNVYLFGHCNASEELVDMLMKFGCHVKGILDNSAFKQGHSYMAVPIIPPDGVLKENDGHTVVCIVSRFYAAMAKQLEEMGYIGLIRKLVDYDSYSEYSLSKATLARKRERVERGIRLLEGQKERLQGYYRLYCPFPALGDVYYTMSYLPFFLKKKNVQKYVVFVVSSSCGEIVRIFGGEHVEVLSQEDMDESVQAVLYTGDSEAYISHHDWPYAVQLIKALYVGKFSLEEIYKYGVFGLEKNCKPRRPVRLDEYDALSQIESGRAVILSPYAKSVASIQWGYWKRITEYYKKRKYQVFTNIVGEEQAVEGSVPLKVKLAEFQSVVERAGTFIGMRSGLCDVVQNAHCRKIALYPDCYYSDTRWKVKDIFELDGFENIVV